MENHVRTASELERKYNLSSTLTTLKNGIEQNASSLKSTQNSLTNFVNVTYANQIQDLQNQIDGNVTTWFYPGVPTLSNAPAVDWTTDTLKDQHLGDMYYDDDTGYAYRFTKSNNTYQWVELSDSDISEALSIARSAYDIATDHKRRVFFTPYTVEGTTYTTPQPPYDAGDLWVKDSNKIMCCINGRDEQGVYTSSDWVDSAYYTAHDEASTAYNNAKTYADTTFATQVSLNETETAIIGRVRRDEVASALRDIKYVDSTDPSSAWTTDTERANHVGDVWYDTTNQIAKYYDNGFTWKETLTNGARIFINTPTTPYSIGDIYLKGITEDNETTWYLYVCQKDKETGAFEATDFILQPTLVNYSEFKQTATSIGLEVSQKMSTGDFNKASIIAEINGGVGSAKIKADNVDITSKTFDLTTDDLDITSTNFKVDKLGNVKANNLDLKGGNVVLYDDGSGSVFRIYELSSTNTISIGDTYTLYKISLRRETTFPLPLCDDTQNMDKVILGFTTTDYHVKYHFVREYTSQTDALKETLTEEIYDINTNEKLSEIVIFKYEGTLHSSGTVTQLDTTVFNTPITITEYDKISYGGEIAEATKCLYATKPTLSGSTALLANGINSREISGNYGTFLNDVSVYGRTTTAKLNCETVLYDNSSGSNGNISLNDSSANYDYIEIYFRSNDNAYNSVKVYKPNGKSISLVAHWYSSANTRGYVKEKVVSISGTNITNTHYSEWTLRTNQTDINNSNSIYITRVVGYKL